jgi:hypothetical protein
MRAMEAPSMRMSPDVGVSSPPSRWSSVLFPDPDGPTIATSSPAAMSSETPARAFTSVSP